MGGMQPKDLYRLRWAGSPRLSPDGTTVAFVVTRVDEETNSYLGDIYLAPSDGSAPARPFVSSERSDGNPVWSPDGSHIAFTSTRSSDEAQLYVIPVGGGEARRLTDLPEAVEEVAWSPDGTRIAFSARVRDAAYEEEDERKREPRRITRLSYRLDNVGWTFDRPRHLFVVPADGSAPPEQLTTGEADDSGIAWSPDGTRIAFASRREPDWDVSTRSDLYVVPSAGGEPRRITSMDGSCGAPSWSPDGDTIAYEYRPGEWDDPRHARIAVIDVASGTRRILTEDLDRNCSPYPHIREPLFTDRGLLFALEDSGNTPLYRVPADGSGKPEPVIEGDMCVTGYDSASGVVVSARTTPTCPAEIYTGDTRISHVTDAFTSGIELQAPERYLATSADGSEVECWIVRPAGFEPDRRYPVLLNIHGGPFTQYGNRFFDEFQVYAGAGYAVVYCNPRGSSGYGEAWGRAIRGPAADGPGMGSVDYDDVMAALDTALQRYDFCDPDRLGVLGGSYGGFMTSWIVSHTDRFKAAVSERAVNNWVSFFGSSDEGPAFKGEIGAWPFEDVEAYLRISPTSYAPRINTPLLILHSENDLRCNIEQAQHLFAILRLLGKEVEFVRFPAESHELSRSGAPVHRVRRFEIILEWFARYLA